MSLQPYARKAQFHETDQMGIIHHSNYIKWFEEARVDFMEQIGYGYDKSVAAGIDMAVLGVCCDYHAMVRFGDTVHIQPVITFLSPSRMTVRYRVVDAATGAMRTTGESRHCFYHGGRQRAVSLKKELPELYALFDSLCERDG